MREGNSRRQIGKSSTEPMGVNARTPGGSVRSSKTMDGRQRTFPRDTTEGAMDEIDDHSPTSDVGAASSNVNNRSTPITNPFSSGKKSVSAGASASTGFMSGPRYVIDKVMGRSGKTDPFVELKIEIFGQLTSTKVLIKERKKIMKAKGNTREAIQKKMDILTQFKVIKQNIQTLDTLLSKAGD